MSVQSEMLHASCVAIGGHAVLIEGRSGSGKSDLALRLIDRGAALVSDDYTLVSPAGDTLVATAPAKIAGLIEARGVGLLHEDHIADAPVALLVAVDQPVVRLPDGFAKRTIAGVAIPAVALAALEASAPIKVERALALAVAAR